MNHYSMNDFLTYYGNSFMLHPHTGETFKLAGPHPTIANAVVTDTGSTIKLEELDWKHVQTPEQLGYRGLLDGKALYYLTRKPGRRTRKGVTPEAIIITIPAIIRSVAMEVGSIGDVEKHAKLQDWLAKAIFVPKYINIEDAINNLKNKKHALGFALSANWAVTIGLYKTEPFLLHFKNLRVAGSVDGVKWDFYDKDAQRLFNSFLKGDFKNVA